MHKIYSLTPEKKHYKHYLITFYIRYPYFWPSAVHKWELFFMTDVIKLFLNKLEWKLICTYILIFMLHSDFSFQSSKCVANQLFFIKKKSIPPTKHNFFMHIVMIRSLAVKEVNRVDFKFYWDFFRLLNKWFTDIPISASEDTEWFICIKSFWYKKSSLFWNKQFMHYHKDNCKSYVLFLILYYYPVIMN